MTAPLDWLPDWAERIENKIDAHREETRRLIYGDPGSQETIGIDGRLRKVERDVSAVKALGVSAGVGFLGYMSDYIKRKLGGQ